MGAGPMQMDVTVWAAGAVFVTSLAAISFLLLRLLRQPRGRARPADAARPGPRALSGFAGKVWVIDGDTVIVNNQRIRLFGIDAPEIGQKGGALARAHLIRIAGGTIVRVEPDAIDRYGRIVARLWQGEADLSRRMVSDGFAVATTRWDMDYAPDEFEARRRQRGLWHDDPVRGIGDPWKYRRWRSAAS
jgi:endonuclease YncB( thermonuclease family)